MRHFSFWPWHILYLRPEPHGHGAFLPVPEGAAVGPRRLELFALRTLGNRDLAFGVADRSRSGNRQRGLAGLGGGCGFGDRLLGVRILVLFLDFALGGLDHGFAVLVGAGGHGDGVGAFDGLLDLVNGLVGGGDLLDVDVEQQLDGLLLDGSIMELYIW